MSLLCGPLSAQNYCETILTEVILDALSDAAYRVALNKPEHLMASLVAARSQLELGFTHEIHAKESHNDSLHQNSFQYRVLMLEPTSHGRVVAGSTKIITLYSNDPGLLPPLAFLDSTDSEGIEIDEGFLANTIALHALKTTSQSGDGDLSIDSGDPRDNVQFMLEMEPLLSPVSSLDDHCTLYIRTADLGRIGLLNEDWAIASSGPKMNHRLVRIVVNDQLVRHSGKIYGSPVLLHNIITSAERNTVMGVPRVILRPSPFGQNQPAIPTAKSVTIARIASPFSINKAYQMSSLHSLKSYFASSRRLVRQSDVIALSLAPELPSTLQDDLGEEGWGVEHAAVVNEVVYFLVTNVEHSIIPNGTSTTEQDLYTGSTIGELGCWVDPSITRITQIGLEHARAPEVGSYLESDVYSIFSFLKGLPSSHLLDRDSPFSKVLALVSASSTNDSMNYNLQLSILLKGARGVGKFSTVCWVAQRVGMHILEVDCFNLVGENDVKTEGTLRIRFEQANNCSPCILVLRHIEALSQTTQPLEPGKEPTIVNALRECIMQSAQSWKITGFPVIVVATSSDPSRVPGSILSCFKHEVTFEAPNEEERLETLQALLRRVALAPDVSLRGLSIQTAALLAIDLSDLVVRAEYLATERATKNVAQVLITAGDFEDALKKVRAAYSENIGAPKIPNVTWDDVGGLAHVKTDILDTVQLPLERPELFADGLKKRSGILLYGPPGTGKTLVAKAVATSCSLNFFSVKGPELLNMYIGESEANVRRVFQRARDAKPCVIFFDELDSIAPKRGNHGDSGGVMDRIVSQLLSEIDGMSNGNSGADVFVIGATNRPDLLDAALLRPGRFDKMLYLGVSETHEAQLRILEALTRKFNLHPSLSLEDITERCPLNYTGADFYALCSDAMLTAMSRTAEQLEGRIAKLNEAPENHIHPYPITPQYYLAELALPDDIRVQVTSEDFLRALQNLTPSVSQSEMEHYARVQRRFSRTTWESKGVF